MQNSHITMKIHKSQNTILIFAYKSKLTYLIVVPGISDSLREACLTQRDRSERRGRNAAVIDDNRSIT